MFENALQQAKNLFGRITGGVNQAVSNFNAPIHSPIPQSPQPSFMGRMNNFFSQPITAPNIGARAPMITPAGVRTASQFVTSLPGVGYGTKLLGQEYNRMMAPPGQKPPDNFLMKDLARLPLETAKDTVNLAKQLPSFLAYGIASPLLSASQAVGGQSTANLGPLGQQASFQEQYKAGRKQGMSPLESVAFPAIQELFSLMGLKGIAGHSTTAIQNHVENNLAEIKPELNPIERKAAANNFTKDQIGRFTGRTKNNPFYEDPYLNKNDIIALRKKLGLPLDANYKKGFIDLNAKIGQEQSAETDPFLRSLSENVVPSDITKPMLPLESAMQRVPERLNPKAPIIDQVPLEEQKSLENIVAGAGYDVKKKVTILDYLKTPEYVLEKIGLGKEAHQLRVGYEGYRRDLKTEIGRISNWQKQVPDPSSSIDIFKYLDGDKNTVLSPQELKVAGEIQLYLKGWASKLGLPPDRQISHYITHIFDRELIQKEFDPELAKLIQDRTPGSVYDPFLEKRLGAMGFKQNVWEALDAYVKRGTRKFNMDPALKSIADKSVYLSPENENYVRRYTQRINMRPSEIDNLVDNLIKQSPIGYKFGQRPTNILTQKFRQMIYRSTLGLNVGAALRNLTQGVNTYAKLGEGYTLKGYFDLVRNGTKELFDNGLLEDNVIQDRKFNAIKSFWQKTDEGLFKFFDTVEKINRGSAYYGAKAKGLAKGLTEAQAVEFAKRIVRETQFQFGVIDSPVALSSDIAKIFSQLHTYTIKQTEFLGGMFKKREFGGLFRYAAGSLALVVSLGRLFGMKPTDMIPSFRLDSPITQLGTAPLGLFSPDPKVRESSMKKMQKSFPLLIPAGIQMKKTLEGLRTASRGFDTNASGNVTYTVPSTIGNKVKGALFGEQGLSGNQNYYQNQGKPLSPNQSIIYKSGGGQEYYNAIQQKREINREKKQQNQSITPQESSLLENIQNKFKEFTQPGVPQSNVPYNTVPSQNTGVSLVPSALAANNQRYQVVNVSGTSKVIDLQKTVTPPNPSGDTFLDEQLNKQYQTQINSKLNDLRDLYVGGKLTKEDYLKQSLNMVNQQKLHELSKPLHQPELTGDNVLDEGLLQSFQSQLASKSRQVFSAFQSNAISQEDASNMLENLNQNREQLKNLLKTYKGKGRVGRPRTGRHLRPPSLSQKIPLPRISPIRLPKGVSLKKATMKAPKIPNLSTSSFKRPAVTYGVIPSSGGKINNFRPQVHY